MDNYVPIEKVVTAIALLKRWSITIDELDEIVRNGMFRPYLCKDRRRNNNGEYYYCKVLGRQLPRLGYYGDYDEEYGEYAIRDVVFSEMDVIGYEFEHPELADKPVVEHSATSAEWFTASDVQKLLKMSPSLFCSFVNNNKIRCYSYYEDFGRTWTKEPDFKSDFLDLNNYGEYNFHVADIQERLADVPELSNLKGYLPPLAAEHQGASSDVVHQNNILRQKLAELETKLNVLESGQTPQELNEQKGKPRTAPACEAAQASHVERWKGYAIVMAKVAYDCGLEDRAQVTRSEYKALVKRHGELSGQALELLREALPDGVTKKTGGPASQV